MLVLITYDVNTEDAAGRKRAAADCRNASTMDSVCKTPSLSAC